MSDSTNEMTQNSVTRAQVIRFAIAGFGIVMLLWLGIWLVRRSHGPDQVLHLSGRIEGDDSAVSSKVTGRVVALRYREGDFVKAGDEIAILDDEQVAARERSAQAAVEQAQSKVQSASEEIAVLEQQRAQNLLETEQSQQDASGRVKQAEAELAAAEAEHAQQQSNLQLAEFDKNAYTKLAREGAVSERQGKEAASKAEAQQAAVAASKRRVEAARGALTLAQSTLTNPAIRKAGVLAVDKQVLRQKAEVASADSAVRQAMAQLAEAQANRNDLVIRAPFDGVVVTRTAEPGEVITAGTPIVTLLDLRKVYLRGFVPEGEVGRVKLGQEAHVFLDSSPKVPLKAEVSRIDPQATFTPENTYFRDDRVKQVVGVKLELREGFGNAKPGMPADGDILVSGTGWPAGKRRE